MREIRPSGLMDALAEGGPSPTLLPGSFQRIGNSHQADKWRVAGFVRLHSTLARRIAIVVSSSVPAPRIARLCFVGSATSIEANSSCLKGTPLVAPSIDEIEVWVGSRLPADYREFLTQHTDEVQRNDLVLLYGRSSFVERNETYEAKEYCPGYVTIGSDSGDNEFILSVDEGRVLWVDGGSMNPQDAELVAEDFSAWLAMGCPLPADDAESTFSAIEQVAVFLEERPKFPRTLLLIKEALGITTSIVKLRKSLDSIPCSIAVHLSYMRAIKGCAKVNAVEKCLGIRSLSDPEVRLPLDWQERGIGS